VFWYWFFAGPALLLAALSLGGERKRAAYVARRLSEALGPNPKGAPLPPASVIVPVKGADEGLRENLAALASLDYPDYELLVVARAADDIPPGVLPSRVKIVLAHGNDWHTAEKVQNLQAAVSATRKRSQIFAFADSDGRVTRRWLRALAAPLAEPGVGAATGYRWFTPVPPTFWTIVRGVWDAVVEGTMGPGDNRFAWGGAMAIRKETFVEARVAEYWKNSLSDDYALSAAVHAAGLSIAYAPGALTPCLEHVSAARFFSWMRRQLAITRVYNPRQWWPALIAHIFYCGGMAASVMASVRGYRLAEWALAAQLFAGMLKGFNRAALARAALPEYRAWFRRYAWVHAVGVPLAAWIWLVGLAASAFGNTIEWRGYRYGLKRGAGIIST
jgi:cellulose synthase/poly-beta-1,6-N-acetylglucosamine synthase-like glycosyltransferase